MITTRYRCYPITTLLAGAMLLVGCGSNPPPPTDTLAQAELAVKQAAQSEAGQYAGADLALAQDKLARSRDALAAEDHVRARRLAEQALVDAELAEARAEAERQVRTAAELRGSVDALQMEANRPAPLN